MGLPGCREAGAGHEGVQAARAGAVLSLHLVLPPIVLCLSSYARARPCPVLNARMVLPGVLEFATILSRRRGRRAPSRYQPPLSSYAFAMPCP
eukprot:2398736-Rhodomonas_salina.1